MGLDSAEIAMRLEDELGIEFPDSGTRFETCADVHAWIVREMERRGKLSTGDVAQPGAMTEAQIWSCQQRILSDHLNIPVSRIQKESRLVKDLGLD